jgi:hypothetical protein
MTTIKEAFIEIIWTVQDQITGQTDVKSESYYMVKPAYQRIRELETAGLKPDFFIKGK